MNDLSRKPHDELPRWRQLLWPRFEPPRYQQAEGLDAYLAAYWRALNLSAAQPAELLAGDDPPGEVLDRSRDGGHCRTR